MEGSYSHQINLIFRPKSGIETFIQIYRPDVDMIVTVDDDDFATVFENIDSYDAYVNIVLDSRLRYLITMVYLHYGDRALVYDVNRLRVMKSGSFLVKESSHLSRSPIFHRLLILELIVTWHMKKGDLCWDSVRGMKIVSNTHTLVDSLIDFVGIQTMTVDRKKVEDCAKAFIDLSKEKYMVKCGSLKEFSLETIYTTLNTLKNNGISLDNW